MDDVMSRLTLLYIAGIRAPHSVIFTTLIKMPANRAQARSWMFTINNWTPAEREQLERLEVKYIIFGEEVGEEGTPHLQGFITFMRPYRLAPLKKLFPRAHWEQAIAADAANYCGKGENIHLRDNRTQGQRTDLTAVTSCLRQHGLSRVIEEFPEAYIKYSSGLHKMAIAVTRPRTEPPHVVYCWGGTGTGKTRYVVERENDLWISSGSLKWFDGYLDQSAVLFDDIRASHCKFEFLLRVLDRYPLRVPVKGGFVEWRPERIYLTAPCPPEELYNTTGTEDMHQLRRRIHEVKHFNGWPPAPPPPPPG